MPRFLICFLCLLCIKFAYSEENPKNSRDIFSNLEYEAVELYNNDRQHTSYMHKIFIAYAKKCTPSKTCKQLRSCAEAIYRLEICGHDQLDRDKDGIPCEWTHCN